MTLRISHVTTRRVVGGGFVVIVVFDDGRQIAWPWVADPMFVTPMRDEPTNDDVVRAMWEAVQVMRWHDEAMTMCNAIGGVA